MVYVRFVVFYGGASALRSGYDTAVGIFTVSVVVVGTDRRILVAYWLAAAQWDHGEQRSKRFMAAGRRLRRRHLGHVLDRDHESELACVGRSDFVRRVGLDSGLE